MAPFSNLFSFLFLTTLLLSLQIDARDSQFFSKVTHVNNNNNVKETEVPNNEGPVNKPEEQRPVFIPETDDNSYGLYGHESGLNPPSTTTTTYQQYKTESEETTKFPKNNYYTYNKDAYNTNQNEMSDTRQAGTYYSNNNNNYYNKDAYGERHNELSDTKYTEGGYNSMENQNNKQNKYYYNNNNNGANERYSFNNNGANNRYFYNNDAANNRYNSERQGLSDTRFMEGGKYFYDVNSKYNPTLYGGGAARGVNSENWYNNRGYFGNNNANSYQNKKNSIEGYQSQEVFEDDQEKFEP